MGKGLGLLWRVVIPWAVVTLVTCGRSEGTAVNIGHETAEIIAVKDGGVDDISLQKAGDFALSQLTHMADIGAHLRHAEIVRANGTTTKRLVGLLAAKIADAASAVDVPDEVVLAGGGSKTPSTADSLSVALGRKAVAVDDTVMGNAAGFEKAAAMPSA